MSVFDLNAVRSRNVCVTYVEAEDVLTLVSRPSSSKFALKNISLIISVVSYCFITVV